MTSAIRVLRLLVGLWSPSRIAVIHGLTVLAEFRGESIPRLGWLDRWEVRNHRADCRALGYDPMAPPVDLFVFTDTEPEEPDS